MSDVDSGGEMVRLAAQVAESFASAPVSAEVSASSIVFDEAMMKRIEAAGQGAFGEPPLTLGSTVWAAEARPVNGEFVVPRGPSNTGQAGPKDGVLVIIVDPQTGRELRGLYPSQVAEGILGPSFERGATTTVEISG